MPKTNQIEDAASASAQGSSNGHTKRASLRIPRSRYAIASFLVIIAIIAAYSFLRIRSTTISSNGSNLLAANVPEISTPSIKNFYLTSVAIDTTAGLPKGILYGYYFSYKNSTNSRLIITLFTYSNMSYMLPSYNYFDIYMHNSTNATLFSNLPVNTSGGMIGNISALHSHFSSTLISAVLSVPSNTSIRQDAAISVLLNALNSTKTNWVNSNNR